MVNLKPMDDNIYLDKKNALKNATCAICGKKLIKSNNASDYNEEKHALFNRNHSILCCKEHITDGALTCTFCVCFVCKAKKHNETDNTKISDDGKTRKRCSGRFKEPL